MGPRCGPANEELGRLEVKVWSAQTILRPRRARRNPTHSTRIVRKALISRNWRSGEWSAFKACGGSQSTRRTSVCAEEAENAAVAMSVKQNPRSDNPASLTRLGRRLLVTMGHHSQLRAGRGCSSTPGNRVVGLPIPEFCWLCKGERARNSQVSVLAVSAWTTTQSDRRG